MKENYRTYKKKVPFQLFHLESNPVTDANKHFLGVNTV